MYVCMYLTITETLLGVSDNHWYVYIVTCSLFARYPSSSPSPPPSPLRNHPHKNVREPRGKMEKQRAASLPWAAFSSKMERSQGQKCTALPSVCDKVWTHVPPGSRTCFSVNFLEFCLGLTWLWHTNTEILTIGGLLAREIVSGVVEDGRFLGLLPLFAQPSTFCQFSGQSQVANRRQEVCRS